MLKITLIILLLIALSACSDSQVISNFDSPPNGDPLKRPVLLDGILYEYSSRAPSEEANKSRPGFLTKITPDNIDVKYSVFLDTDPYENRRAEVSAQTIDFLGKTNGPELVVFGTDERLYALNTDTRHTTELLNLNSNANPNGREILCDLQAFLSIDLGNTRSRFLPVLHLPHVNIRAVSLQTYEAFSNDCSSVPLEHTKHYSINLIESETDEYRVRRSATDDSPSQILNFPELEANKRVTSSSLMYAGRPFFDSALSELGYLGVNTETNLLEFWSSSIQGTVLDLPTWSKSVFEERLLETNTDRKQLNNTNNHDTFNAFIHPYSIDYFRESDPQASTIDLIIGGNIVRLTRATIFSRNGANEVWSEISAPRYNHSILSTDIVDLGNQADCVGSTSVVSFANILSEPLRTTYLLPSGLDAEGNRMVCLLPSDGNATNITTRINDADLADGLTPFLEKTYFKSENIVLLKNYSSVENHPNEILFQGDRSLTQIATNNTNIEETVIARTDTSIENLTQAPAVNFFDHSEQKLSTLLYGTSTISVNSIIADYVELRTFPGSDLNLKQSNVIFNGLSTIVSDINGAQIRAISGATANCYDQNETTFFACPDNQSISTTSEAIRPSEKNKLMVINNDYGLARLLVAELNENNEVSDTYLGLYYFDPIDVVFGLETDEEAPEHETKPMELICILEDDNGNQLSPTDDRSCYANSLRS